MVIHDQGVGVQFSRHSERELFTGDATVIHDGRVAERSPGNREEQAAELVVYDFMSA